MALAAAASVPGSRGSGPLAESKETMSVEIEDTSAAVQALGFTTSEEEELKLCLVDIQVTAAREVSKVDVSRIGMPSAEASTVDVDGKAVRKEGPKETQYMVVSKYVTRKGVRTASSGAGEESKDDADASGLPKVDVRRVWRSWNDFQELEKALASDKPASKVLRENSIALPTDRWYALALPQSGSSRDAFESRARAQALAQRAEAAAAAGKLEEAARAREESAAADPTSLRLALLGEYLQRVLSLQQARDCTGLRSFLRKKLRPDWPAPLGPINLDEQDLPHASSVTEWWYLNCHFDDEAGRPHSAFVAFFRAVAANDSKGEKIWMEALNWAITDVQAGRYIQESLMHKDSPGVLADMFDQGLVTKDNMIRKAYRMIFDKKNVPLPDRIFPDDPVVHHDRLELDYVCATLKKDGGDYMLTAKTHDGRAGIDLRFHPTKPPVRHGVDGVVMGHDGDDMFYYLIPRCTVTGTFRLDDEVLPPDSAEAQADDVGDRYMWMGRSLKSQHDPKADAKLRAYKAAAEGSTPEARELAQKAVDRLEAVATGRAQGETEAKAKAEAESKASAEFGAGASASTATTAMQSDSKPKRAGVPDGLWRTVVNGQGWYDHEFGGERADGNEKQQGTHYAWNWAAIQLDNGMEVSVATLSNPKEAARLVKEGKSPIDAELGRRVILIDRDGRRTEAADVEFIGTNNWTSLRTFYDYPTHFTLQVPSLGLDLKLAADVDDQEFVTIIAKPAFWEGRVTIEGTLGGAKVGGVGFIERNGFNEMASVMEFFKRVGGQVRKAVQFVYPDNPTLEDGVMLIASEDTRHYVEGVDMTQIDRNLLKPVRHISDQGGKSWRSYGALACIDLVGGDSRKFAHWLAMPEFMHVGSLIVDDFQDDSKLRRGVPCSHLVYGTNVSINAGTAAYFQGQKMLPLPCMSQRTLNTVYDLYFAALRAGHAGQALDLAGLEYCIDECIEQGNWQLLLDRILAIHRLKTAVPAGSLARMGVYAGSGTTKQATAVGVYFEAVGVAFQIMDDVLNLRGLRTDGSDKKANVVLKTLGEDIMCGKVTMPVVLAVQLLEKQKMKELWEVIKTKPQDPVIVQECIDVLEDCGAITKCCDMASQLVDDAWADMDDAVPDSFSKIMIYTFGRFVINRGV